MRSFPFRYQRRSFTVDVTAVADGWELWISEAGRRLACAGRLTSDEAIEAGRHGEDRLYSLVEEVKSNVLTGRLALQPTVAA